MSTLTIEQCPETGICSVIKEDGRRIDLMPDEVGQLRDAAGNPEDVKSALADIDSTFAASLAPDELDQLSSGIK